jgi:hypothetical protein
VHAFQRSEIIIQFKLTFFKFKQLLILKNILNLNQWRIYIFLNFPLLLLLFIIIIIIIIIIAVGYTLLNTAQGKYAVKETVRKQYKL